MVKLTYRNLMPNSYFQFKQFTIYQDKCAMKVTTDACLFGAWVANDVKNEFIKNAIDIGTGTGLLSLMILQKNPEIEIDAIEIDSETSVQASENIKASSWSEKARIINEELKHFTPLKKYELIICNPPFYENELQPGNQKKKQAHHSSDLTLKDLVHFIKNNLANDGTFYLLLPFKRDNEIKKLLTSHHLFIQKIVFVSQSESHGYSRIMLKGRIKDKNFTETIIETITICNSKNEYTPEFINLLKDYYLKL